MHGFPSRARLPRRQVWTRLSSCRFTWPISLATLAGVQHQRGAQACLLEFFGSTAILAGLGMAAPAAAETTLHILHINDLHSRIQPINRFDSTCSAEDDAAGECFGGVARIAAAVNQLRSELEPAGENVIVLDAGDQYQGSLFFTTYRGAAAGEFMEAIGLRRHGAWQSRVQQRPRGPACRCSMRSASRFVSGNLDVSQDPTLNGRVDDAIVLRCERHAGRHRLGALARHDGDFLARRCRHLPGRDRRAAGRRGRADRGGRRDHHRA